MMKTGVSLYGGFAGTETSRDQRDWTANRTVLSGDLLDDDPADDSDWSNRTDNSIHVVFALNVQNCTLDGFTVSGGYADGPGFGADPSSEDQGSGVNVYYATPHFENVIFERNWAANHGAFNDHGNSTLSHCTFRHNFAQVLGAGLYMHTNADTHAIICTFTGNETPNDGGGAYSRSQVGGLVQNSTFTQNTANHGAGMYNAENSASTISACTFTSNLAITGGGGIFAIQANLTVTDCFFSLNHAAESITDGAGGGGGSGGGGFWSTGGNPTVTNCTFTENIASFGGGVYFNEGSTGLVQSCTFTNNLANEAGGLYDLSSPVTISQCTFTSNTASGGSFAVGGGFSSYFSDAILEQCIFSGNHAYLGGGGAYCEGAAPQLLNSMFIANGTTGHEQGWGGGLLNGYFTNATEVNLLFVGNSADWGGAIANAVFSNPLIANCTISENTAAFGTGGAIHSFDDQDQDHPPTITNTVAWSDHPAELGGLVNGVQYSCIEGGSPGTGPGNVSDNPRFVTPPSPGPDGIWGTADDVLGDLRVLPGSPCIDAGDNDALPIAVPLDLAGAPRRHDDPSIPDRGAGDSSGGAIDIGAYEFQGVSCSADFDGDGSSGTDADIDAFFACLAGNCCPTCAGPDFNRDGAAGTDADIESFFRVLAGGPC
jgi:hypothetical protein